MPKFLVDYSLTYKHVVRVGVNARSPESASTASTLSKFSKPWSEP